MLKKYYCMKTNESLNLHKTSQDYPILNWMVFGLIVGCVLGYSKNNLSDISLLIGLSYKISAHNKVEH